MDHRFVIGLLAGTLPAFGAAPAAAQAAQDSVPPLARVAGAIIDPFPVRFSRGDSAQVQVTLVDSVGMEVTGVPWSFRTTGELVRTRRVGNAESPTGYVLSGDQPGSQVLYVSVGGSGAAGARSRDVDSLTVTVAEWPVARIEIAPLAYRPYAGTTVRLQAQVFTDHGTAHEHANLIWRTDDPCYARVMPDGAITLGQPATVSVVARAEGVSAKTEIKILNNPVRSLDISPNSAQTRAGDVVRFRVSAENSRGDEVERIALSFGISAVDSAGAEIDTAGYFVAENPGTYLVRVAAGEAAAEAIVEAAPRPAPTPVEVEGRGMVRGSTTRGLWLFTGQDGRDYAYTGTEDATGAARVYAWDVTDPTNVRLTDSVLLAASAVGHIQTNSDASWAVVSRLAADSGRGGITVLDLASPGHPSVLADYSEGLSGGIGALWVNAPTPMVYAADAATGLVHILDLATPQQPRDAGVWALRASRAEVNDLWGDGKYLYLAAGADGLVVVDIGERGSLTAPVSVATLTWPRAAAQGVFRAGRYAYVSETWWGCDQCVNGPRGGVRVIDAQDPRKLRAVAHFTVPEAGAGGVWVENSVLFAAYHQGGVRIVDVAGELRRDLYHQGRQAGWLPTGAPEGTGFRTNAPLARAAIPFKGHLYVADGNSGLWVLSHRRAARLTQ